MATPKPLCMGALSICILYALSGVTSGCDAGRVSESSTDESIGQRIIGVGFCDGGILDGDGSTCCAASCGTCGGSGCSGRPGGAASCCEQTIRDSGRSCLDNGPPCIMYGDPSCEHGETYTRPQTGTTVCCPAYCGTGLAPGSQVCGGGDCSERLGGTDACCSGAIEAAGEVVLVFRRPAHRRGRSEV